MSTAAELVTAVREAAKDTPYAVRETPRGFDLTIDVVDARWLAILKAHGLKQVFTHQVKLDEAKQQMVIVDVSNTLNWGAGGSSPRLHAAKSVQRGRVYQKSFRKEWGVDLETGEVGKVVDYSFDASEGRNLIRDVAKARGWSERMGGEQKGAVIVGVGTLVLLVVAFGVVGLVKLLG
jgi:hypothetical protein